MGDLPQKRNINKENNLEQFVSVTIDNTEDELKQKLKSYVVKKNTSLHEIKNKLDSINSAEKKYLFTYNKKEKDQLVASGKSLFIPALYFYKKNELLVDSILNTRPVKYSLTNADGHIYIIINLKNANGNNDQLIIDLISKEIE